MIILAVVALLIATSGPAHAYIDPGSGSYALQMAMAGILGAAYGTKLFWQRIKTSFAGLFAGKGSAASHHAE